MSFTHVEPHIKESGYIRDLVFGFGDSVNTSLGVGGVKVAADVVILAALVGNVHVLTFSKYSTMIVEIGIILFLTGSC